MDPLSNFSSSLVVGDWEHVREAWWGCLGLRADGRCSACTCESGRSMESGEGKGMSAEVEIERSRERERETHRQIQTHRHTETCYCKWKVSTNLWRETRRAVEVRCHAGMGHEMRPVQGWACYEVRWTFPALAEQANKTQSRAATARVRHANPTWSHGAENRHGATTADSMKRGTHSKAKW